MRYVYTVSGFRVLAIEQARGVLPQHFSFREEREQLLLVVEPPGVVDDEQVFGQVQQECDRLFFLTGEQLAPKILRKENSDGRSVGFGSFTADAFITKSLSTEVDRQQWHIPLAVQLRLWQLAQSPNVPIAARTNLLFQIIEISYPNTNDQNQYRQYKDPRKRPHPRTEAKLLRHLASHGNTKRVTHEQLKRYCQHLSITEEFHNPTDIDYLRVLREGFPVVESEARRIIEASITRKT